jgi:hypothetical protein
MAFAPASPCGAVAATKKELVMSRSVVAILGVLIGLGALVGCAAPSEDDAGSAAGAAKQGAAPSTIAASAPITAANFETHPSILAVQNIIDEIGRGVAGDKFDEKSANDVCKGFAGESSRQIFTQAGKPRLLRVEGGQEDSVTSEVYYYDASGILRFVASNDSGALGCMLGEGRQYYDADGKLLIAVSRRGNGEMPEGSDMCTGARAALAAAAWEKDSNPTIALPHAKDKPLDAYDLSVTPAACY